MPPAALTTTEIVAIVICTVLLPTISFCILCFYRRWKNRKIEKLHGQEELASQSFDGGGGDSEEEEGESEKTMLLIPMCDTQKFIVEKFDLQTKTFKITDHKHRPVLTINSLWPSSLEILNQVNSRVAVISHYNHKRGGANPNKPQHHSAFLGKYHYYHVEVGSLKFNLKMHKLPDLHFTGHNLYMSGDFVSPKYKIYLSTNNNNNRTKDFPNDEKVLAEVSSKMMSKSSFNVKITAQADPLIILSCIVAIQLSINEENM